MTDVSVINPNKALWEKGDFTRIAETMRQSGQELVDTLGRSFSIDIMRLVMSSSQARTVGPAIASMLIYVLMALVLYFRPAGLFPAKGR